MGHDRRALLRAAVAGLAALAGCATGGRETPTLTPAEVPEVTATGTPATREAGTRQVVVGADGPGFDPATLRIPQGATVRWVWATGDHSVNPVQRPERSDWTGTELDRVFGPGNDYRHTFDVPGRYVYRCDAHPGVRGEVLVRPTNPVRVTVGPDGDLAFDPLRFRVAPGTTVAWFWDTPGHNIVVEDRPAGTDWSGTEGGPGRTFEAGHVHRHTFETPGAYPYHCAPHESAGMWGEIVVGYASPYPLTPSGRETAFRSPAERRVWTTRQRS